MKGNKKTFIAALPIAKKKIHTFLIGKLAEYGQLLLEDAQFRAEYTSFTGNTLISLAFGVYENTNLIDVVFISGVQKPVHAKVQEGTYVYLEKPYDGAPRGIYGEVAISDAWGDETSIRTLQDLCPKGGNGIVMTTGTEYSTFLEGVYDMNVLSDTFLAARNGGWMEINDHLNKDVPINRL